MSLIKKVIKKILFQKTYVPLESYFATIDKTQFKFFYDSFFYVKRLEELGAKFFVEKNELYATLSGLKLLLRTEEEIFILDEVFYDKLYKLQEDKKTIVIDIGTNVGFSALYFAQLPNVERVYTYEPFSDTLDQAMINFNNNPREFSKINTHLFALGSSDRKQEVEYSYEWKGSMSIDKCIKPDNTATGVIKTIDIKKASTVVRKILADHPSSFIVIKSDCEGSEYPIFTDLNEAGLLNKIDYCVLETHEGRHQEIEKQLRENNFSFKTVIESDAQVGMIYATRN